MWIALGIIGFLAVLITVIVLLPVKVIIKNDRDDGFMLYYKLLGKTFGEDPDPNDPIVKTLKTAAGVNRLEKTTLKKNVRSEGLSKTVSDSYRLLIELLKELAGLLKLCVVTKLEVNIRCVGDGPDEAAVHYGQCCAVTYGLLNALHGFLKTRKNYRKIDIACDYFGTESLFQFEVVLMVRFGRVLAAFWRTALAESKRMAQQRVDQQK